MLVPLRSGAGATCRHARVNSALQPTDGNVNEASTSGRRRERVVNGVTVLTPSRRDRRRDEAVADPVLGDDERRRRPGGSSLARSRRT